MVEISAKECHSGAAILCFRLLREVLDALFRSHDSASWVVLQAVQHEAEPAEYESRVCYSCWSAVSRSSVSCLTPFESGQSYSLRWENGDLDCAS